MSWEAHTIICDLVWEDVTSETWQKVVLDFLVQECEWKKLDEAPIYFEWDESLIDEFGRKESTFDVSDIASNPLNLDVFAYQNNWEFQCDKIHHCLLVKAEDQEYVKNYFWSNNVEFTFKTLEETTSLIDLNDDGADAIAHKTNFGWYWEVV